jgi:hypothetical protein
MNVRDWTMYLAQGGPDLVIAQLSREMTDHLGAVSDKVHLGHACAVKSVEKHRLLPAHFPQIFETVDFGRAIADRDRHITFLHFDDHVWKRWFQVTVKRCEERRLIFVSTFHKQTAEGVASKSRRFPVLRREKE